MCSRARLRSVAMSERKAPAIYRFSDLELPVPAERSCFAVVARARSRSAFASFMQTSFSLACFSWQRCLATSYAASALTRSTLAIARVWSVAVLASFSALATRSLAFASATQMSFGLPCMASHRSFAALYSDSMRSSSALWTLRSARSGRLSIPVEGVLCACAAPAKPSASAAVMTVSFSFIEISSRRLRSAQQSRDQRDQEQHDEDDEQHLGDFRGAGSDAGEAEDRRDDGDDEERKRPAQHDELLRS